MTRKTPLDRTLVVRALSTSLAASLITLAACASPAPEPVHVIREPISYNTLKRSPAVKNAPRTAAQPALVAQRPAPRPARTSPMVTTAAPIATPAARPAPQPVASTSRPATMPKPTAQPVAQPAPTSVPVATRTVSAPTAAVVSRSVVPAPRVTGTIRDISLLSEFEAHETWVADEMTAVSTERRALQGLISAHYRYEGDPSPANREKLVEKSHELREVARIARSIDENSTRDQVQAIETQVAQQAQDLQQRRRDVTRVIIAIQAFRRTTSDNARARVLESLERFANGTR